MSNRFVHKFQTHNVFNHVAYMMKCDSLDIKRDASIDASLSVLNEVWYFIDLICNLQLCECCRRFRRCCRCLLLIGICLH